MQHIGWCLDQIQITMAHIPRTLNTSEDLQKASNALDAVYQYMITLKELIENPKLKAYLAQLEHTPMQGIQLQAHETQQLLKDLEHMLYVLSLYITNLREIIAHNPPEWGKKADQITLMIEQKFGGERGELRKEFQLALHTEDELKTLVSCEEHLAAFLK